MKKILVIGALAALLLAPLSAVADEGVMVISLPHAGDVELNVSSLGSFDPKADVMLYKSGGEPQPANVAYKLETVEAAGIPLDELNNAAGWLPPGGFAYNSIETEMITGNESLQVAACASCHSGRPNTSG